MLKEESTARLDKKWVVQIERCALMGPLLVTLTLLLGLREPLQPLWLFSLCYGISYVATFILGWKGALVGTLLSSAFLFKEMDTWSLWHIAVFASANLALFIMGLSQDELRKNLFQYHRERQSLITQNEQFQQDQELDRSRYKDVMLEQKNTIEQLEKEVDELKSNKRSLHDMLLTQEQNMRHITSDKESVEEQVFIEQRDKHRLQGMIDQLRGQLQHYEEVVKQESSEGKLLEHINLLRVEKFELSVLESSHLNEKLRMEQQLKEVQQQYRELLEELNQQQKSTTFQAPENPTDEVAVAYTQLRKQFEEKKAQLNETRKDYFLLEGQTDALLKLKELEEWNKEHQLFSVISLQNDLIQELEEKEKEIESLENLLTAGLEGKKDRPRLPPMKKLQTRAKRKKE